MSAIKLNTINPKKYDLKKLDDKGVKKLYQYWRGQDYSQICGCCGEKPYSTEEEIAFVEECRAIVKEELDTRGHVLTGLERKKLRQERGKRGRKK